MPFLAIATNVQITAQTEDILLKEGSRVVASGTGKPEQYVLVRVRGGRPLLFAGTDAPAAFMEVKSIGFPPHGVKVLTSALCDLITKHLGVPGDRIYIVFEDVKASMWGHDGELFG